MGGFRVWVEGAASVAPVRKAPWGVSTLIAQLQGTMPSWKVLQISTCLVRSPDTRCIQEGFLSVAAWAALSHAGAAATS